MTRDSDWKEDPIWKEAEGIHQRWKAGEFDIDEKKAKRLLYSFWTETGDKNLLGRKKKMDARSSNLLDRFATAISEWAVKRESPYVFIDAARELMHSYNLLRSNGCLVAGLKLRQEVQQREHEIANLSAELEKTRKELEGCQKKYQGIWDRNQTLEAENTEYKREKDGQRAQDIADSMKKSSERSQVEDGEGQ